MPDIMLGTISSSTFSAAVATCKRKQWYGIISEHFTCHAQQNPSQRHPARLPGLLQECDHVGGIECPVNMRVPDDDVVQADCAHAEQPGQNDRREEESYTVGAIMLQSKQEYQDDTGYGNDRICKEKKSRNEDGKTGKMFFW